MKRMVAALIALLVVFSFASCKFVPDSEIPGPVEGRVEFTYTENDGVLTVTGLKTVPEDGIVVIPDEVGGKKITAIADGAFAGNEEMKSLSIPRGVTSIGKNIVSACPNLAELTVREGNTVYRSEGNCLIQIGGSGSARDISAVAGDTIIAGCMKSIIPESIRHIGYEAFKDCRGLIYVYIPSFVETVGEAAFAGCGDLVTISFPSNLNSTGDSMFSNCNQLKNITVHGEGGEYSSPEDSNCLLKNNGTELVAGCKNSNIPEGVEVIMDTAFMGMRTMKTMRIPDSVTKIGRSAFQNTGLTALELPAGLVSIGFQGISWNTDIESLTVRECKGESKGSYRSEGNCIIEKATDTLVVGCNSSIIPEGVKKIGELAFARTGITSVTIPASVTEIENYAFWEAENLSYFKLQGAQPKVGMSVIAGTKITEDPFTPEIYSEWTEVMDAGGNVTGYCLSKYKGHSKVYVIPAEHEGKPVVEIGQQAFMENASIEEVVIPSTVKKIAYNAFSNTRELRNIEIIDEENSPYMFKNGCLIEKNGGHLFYAVTFSDKPDGFVFRIPSVVKEIYSSACFNNYASEIVLPEGLTFISNAAFSGARNLKEITIPASVTDMGRIVFDNCSKLETINVYWTVKPEGWDENWKGKTKQM